MASRVDFISIFVRLFRSKNLTLNVFGEWQIVNDAQIRQILGHKTIWGKMLVKLNGEFFAKPRAPASFSLVKSTPDIKISCYSELQVNVNSQGW